MLAQIGSLNNAARKGGYAWAFGMQRHTFRAHRERYRAFGSTAARQIEILKQWIAQGANYSTHWAFVPPQKAPLPEGGPANPVDALVAAHLKLLQLQPSPPRDR